MNAPFQLLLAALTLCASAAVAAGCSETAASTSNASLPDTLNDDRAASGMPPLPPEDAGTEPRSKFRGNPLCFVASDKCMPDDDAQQQATGTQPCVTSLAATGDAAPPAAVGFACRIARDPATNAIAPSCETSSPTAGGDGTTCETGDDCTAGFDCVAGETGTKTCRHYCCSGSCKDYASQNGGSTFCDVQALVDVNQKAPVCMPLKRCELLGSGECTATESCAVVTESGDTGCVTIGEQQVGSSCDEAHCAANLTCLGKPGSRECFKLCSMSSSECGTSQVCATSTVFKDPTFGICQTP